ncbi:MAG: D-alanyl-D-alanine carboxypeptidase/D-alanyl-D-alanine-endopeptidase [Saprospiraceae bacterium]|nr:D-alanyl-D-alanine carboxypeptidase/D-alanyl-D-alanine-endopeptidase [Saprospiraceae bacterium]
MGDGTAFEPTTAVPTWLWEDLGNYYGVGPSGLNFHENAFTLKFSQHPTIGMPPSVSGFSPFVPHFNLKNNVLSSAGGGDDAYIFMSPYATEGVVRGTISAGNGTFPIKGALPDPPLFAAWHLRRMLLEKGVEIMDTASTQLFLEQKGEPTSLRRTFFTWRSQPLAEIIRHANLESVNLYCEAFLRTLALQQYGYGTNEKGIDAIMRFWQSKGVDTEGLFMQDGSGLSPRNGVTPTQLTMMLRVIAQDSTWFTPFYNSLPEAGRTGTMSSMFKQYPSVLGRLRAKSGTITRVRAYSGYATAADGRLIAFSIILNNFTCSQRDIRKKLETFMAELCRL